MNRLLVLPALLAFAGTVLVLADLPALSRPSMADRVRPYVRGRSARRRRATSFSIATFRDVLAPLARSIGERVGRLAGITEDLAHRLERAHAPFDATAFRLRQLAYGAVSATTALALAAAVRPPVPVVALFVLGAPLLAFLVLEQQLASAAARRRTRLVDELPVVVEQLALLLGAGYSLGAAMGAIAQRSDGVCAQDLRTVVGRVRQGLADIDALTEWAALVDVDAVHRLVGVLALNRQGGDLSRIVSDEARAMRRDGHRRLVERIERRNQQVWIPVTVATLVPGVLFMAVPFVQALSLFSGA